MSNGRGSVEGRLTIQQVMEAVPYRLAAKLTAIVELILSLLVFVIIVLIIGALSADAFV